jgi:hypothetical protein
LFPKTECPLINCNYLELDLIVIGGLIKILIFFVTYGKKCCNIAGAGFGSKSKYMFGKVTVQLKLVEGDSAGTVTAFYVSKK